MDNISISKQSSALGGIVMTAVKKNKNDNTQIYIHYTHGVYTQYHFNDDTTITTSKGYPHAGNPAAP